jgi:hypothetical protein
MSKHLTPEGVSKWMAGDSTPEIEQHARECPQCSAELNAIQNALSQFRSFMVNWADRERGGYVPDSATLRRPSPNLFVRRLCWLSAATAITVVALIPVYRKPIESRENAEVIQESMDAELLERINAHLSQTAPASLQPLTELAVTANNSRGEGKR